MYRHSEGVPWHLDGQANSVDVRLTGDFLSDIGLFDEIHDLRCGLGHYLSLIGERVEAGNSHCFGCDISETACRMTKQQFPDVQCMALDLTAPTSHKRRLFIICTTLWYVFSKLDVVIKAIRDLMGHGDKLLVVQNFPPLTSSLIGKAVLPNHQAVIAHFAQTFLPVRNIWYDDSLKSANDN
jgi:hypothetical protein